MPRVRLLSARLRRLARVAFVVVLAAGAALPAQTPTVARAALTATLSGTVLRGLPRLAPAGPTDPAMQISWGIGAPHPYDAQEDAYLQALYTPADPRFEPFLAPHP